MMNHAFFWRAHPALSFGISATLGVFLFFEEAFWPACLWIVYFALHSFRQSLFQVLILLGFSLYSHQLFSPVPQPGLGRAFFSVSAIKPHSSPFQRGWIYSGTLRAFQSSLGEWATRLPCHITVHGDSTQRPLANRDYLIEGRLEQRDSFDFVLKADTWLPIQGSWSLGELRYRAKEEIRSLLEKRLHEPLAASFLTALFTGDLEERSLRYEFGRLGLQHILAISGFHFAILIAFVSILIRALFPIRFHVGALLCTVILYFLFVGNSPPLLRSFLAAALFLVGQLLGRRSSGLNLLGVCLLIEALLDPLAVRNLGFQLSFISCLGIFLFYRPIQQLFPKRSFSAIQQLTLLSQCGSLFSSFFSRALSLTLAVNLAIFPLLLYHFHRFPYLSLVYNLFVPSFAALILSALLLSLLVYAWMPLLSLPLFKVTDWITGQLLTWIGSPPVLLDYALSLSWPGWAVSLYLGCLLTLGITLQVHDKRNLEMIEG